jgi:hypothetical protein
VCALRGQGAQEVLLKGRRRRCEGAKHSPCVPQRRVEEESRSQVERVEEMNSSATGRAVQGQGEGGVDALPALGPKPWNTFSN